MDRHLFKERFASFINQYPNITSGKRKLAISQENSINVITKLSSVSEFRQHKLAFEYFNLHQIRLNEMIRILPVEILSWDDNKTELKTIFVKGFNLEIILSHVFGEARPFWIDLISQFFGRLKQSGFIWGDLAPRNIIIDEQFEYLRFCDFERHLDIRNKEVGANEFDFYLGNYALEEFSSFLFEEEQRIIFPHSSDISPETLILSERIVSKRKLALMHNLFGKRTAYSIQQIKKTEAMIVKAVTPFWINDSPFFPMIHLDKLMLNQPKHFYADLISELYTLTQQQRHEKLLTISNF